MLKILDRVLHLHGLEVCGRQLTEELRRLIVLLAVVRLVDGEGAGQAGAGLLGHVGALLGEGEKNILIPDLVVQLWQHTRLIQQALFVHVHSFIMVAHLGAKYSDVQANLCNYQGADAVDLVLVTLQVDLHLLLCFYVADHV